MGELSRCIYAGVNLGPLLLPGPTIRAVYKKIRKRLGSCWVVRSFGGRDLQLLSDSEKSEVASNYLNRPLSRLLLLLTPSMASHEQVVLLPGRDDAAPAPASSAFSGILHPLPLSVLALSVLAAIRMTNTWRQSRTASGVSRQATPGALVSALKYDRTALPYAPDVTDIESQLEADTREKKKRTKERRKRGRDVSKEVAGKMARNPRQRKPGSDLPRNNTFASDETYASTSATILPILRLNDTSSRNSYTNSSVASSEPDVPGSDEYSGTLENKRSTSPYTSSAETTPVAVSRQAQEHYILAPSLPLPPSSLTTHMLAALVHLAEPFQRVPNESPPRSRRHTRSGHTPLLHRSSSPAPSTSTSVLSGTMSSAPSSDLSPKTPPPSLPSSQSLPTGFAKTYDLYEYQRDLKSRDESPPVWDVERDEHTDEGRDSLSRLTTSVAAPSWDDTLDWTPIRGRIGPTALADQELSPTISSVPQTDDPPSTPHGEEILFPSLNDPPPPKTLSKIVTPNISSSDDVAVLMEELKVARLGEEKWKLESIRQGEENERLKWAWSEELRKWSRKENEVCAVISLK